MLPARKRERERERERETQYPELPYVWSEGAQAAVLPGNTDDVNATGVAAE
jgi:hypothetical protein